MFLMLGLRGEAVAAAPVATMAVTTLVALVTLLRFLAGVRPGTPPAAAVRPPVQSAPPREPAVGARGL